MAPALTPHNTTLIINSPTYRGIPTTFLGISSYFLLDDDPASARFLTPAESFISGRGCLGKWARPRGVWSSTGEMWENVF